MSTLHLAPGLASAATLEAKLRSLGLEQPVLYINEDYTHGPLRGMDDEELFPFVTSANVACGFHAGDPSTMDRTVMSALARGVRVGAHPGHADKANFGHADPIVDPCLVPLRRAPVEPTWDRH